VVVARGKLSDRRTRHDPAYVRAKRESFAARAIYKLEELDRSFRLLGPGRHVLDLGCWPGSWLQYASQRVGDHGVVVGIDLKPVTLALPGHVETMTADVHTLDPAVLIGRWPPFDVVLSDMAPHTTGDRRSDQWRSEELFLRALAVSVEVLRPGGHFAAKVFQGERFRELIDLVRARFQSCKPVRPQATRAQSSEQYVIGRGLRRIRTG
jgi:23S rRNA (uridine2552-2'-O)-methyltransferase